MVAEFVHAAGTSQGFFRGIFVKDSLIVYFAVIITLPSDSHVDVIREKATDRNEAVFVEVCTIVESGNDSVVFFLIKGRMLNIYPLKALTQLICTGHIQDSVRQVFDASSGHSILRPASPEVHTVLDDAALIDVMEFWEGCADKLHTQHWLITFRIDIVNRKVQRFETYIVRSITRAGPTAGIPFCNELVCHPVGNVLRESFPSLDVKFFFQRFNAFCDGSEEVVTEIFLVVVRLFDKLVEQPGVVQILLGELCKNLRRARNADSGFEVFLNGCFVLLILIEVGKLFHFVKRYDKVIVGLVSGSAENDRTVFVVNKHFCTPFL